jgi:geranylgeranyl reductase family protein
MRERVAIVGAGPAGSVTALVLARQGVPVDLIDRCAFPRPKACGDALTRSSIEQLHGLGLADIADQAFRLGRSRYLGTVETPEVAAAAEVDKRSAVHTLPRTSLDAQLVAAACDAGADLVHADVTGIAWSDGPSAQPTVHLRDVDGGDRAARYRCVVGADGSLSRIARAAGLHPGRTENSAFSLRQYLKVDGSWDPSIELFDDPSDDARRTPGFGWILPIDANRANVGVYECGKSGGRGIVARLERFRATVDRHLGAEVVVVDASKPIGGVIRYDFTPERAARAGLLLVGDAAGLSNATSGEGISYALASGQLAATALIEDRDAGRTAANFRDRTDGDFSHVMRRERALVADGRSVGTPPHPWPHGDWDLDSPEGQELPQATLGDELGTWAVVDDDFRLVSDRDLLGRPVLLVDLGPDTDSCRAPLAGLAAQAEAIGSAGCAVVIGSGAPRAVRTALREELDLRFTMAGVRSVASPLAHLVGADGLVIRRFDATDPFLAEALLDVVERP